MMCSGAMVSTGGVGLQLKRASVTAAFEFSTSFLIAANARIGSKAAHQRSLSTNRIEHRVSGTRSQKQAISATGKRHLFPLSEIS